VIINIINKVGIALLELKNNPPIAAHLDGPKAYVFTLELVKIEPRQCHIALITDKLHSYTAAKKLILSHVEHRQNRYIKI